MINRDENENFAHISCNGCNAAPDKQELLAKGGLRGMGWFIGLRNYHLCTSCREQPEHAAAIADAEASRETIEALRAEQRQRFEHTTAKAA